VRSEVALERQDVVVAVNHLGSSLNQQFTGLHSALQRQTIELLNAGLEATKAVENVMEVAISERGMNSEVQGVQGLVNTSVSIPTASISSPSSTSIPASSIDMSSKYELKNYRGLAIIDYIEEWEREVIPRCQAGMTSWWRETDCRQFRSQRKRLYDVITKVDDENNRNKAEKFEIHLKSCPNATWSDVVTLMGMAEKKLHTNEAFNIFDHDIMAEVVKKRKYMQSKDGRDSRKRGSTISAATSSATINI
jgi:hypothetical protein